SDLNDPTLVDGRPVMDWVRGANLFDDYSMENHDIFHPMYQMSPLSDLSYSMVFYKMFGNPVPRAFEHNVEIMNERVLKRIMLANGEYLFPNGADWSLAL